MEIGALFVGTIVQTYRPGMQVEKGDEKASLNLAEVLVFSFSSME